MLQKYQLEVSPWTIVKIVLVLLSFYLIYLVKDVLILLLFAIILSATFRPLINRWEKKIKRVPAVMSLLLIMVALVAFASYIIFPPLIKQVEAFVQALPNLIERINFLSSYKDIINSGVKSLTSNAGVITGSFVNATMSIFGGFFTFIITIVLTVYLLIDKDGFKKFIYSVVPSDSQEAVMDLARKMTLKMGDWFRGQALVGLIAGFIYYIALLIIGVPYALTLGLIAGILDFIPTIGPMIAGIIAALVALSVSPIHAMIVIVLFIVAQQLENSVLVPKIMQKAVGLSPVIIILSVVVGAKLLGLIGALLAVPMSALISVLVQDWPLIKSTFSKDE